MKTESPSVETIKALLRRFEPVIRSTTGDKFYPMDVEPYVRACSLWVQRPGEEAVCVVPGGELSLDRLARQARIPAAHEGPQGVEEGLQGRAGTAGPRRVLLPLRRRPLLDSAPGPRKGAGGIGRGGFGGLRAHNGRAGTLPLPRACGPAGRLDRPAVLAVLPVQRLEEQLLRRQRPRGRLGEGVRVPLRVGGGRGEPGVGGLRGPQLHGGQPPSPLG